MCQPLEDLARIAHDAGALFLVDTVTSLGGMPVAIDDMTIDATYSGTQKCISGPPGLVAGVVQPGRRQSHGTENDPGGELVPRS